MPKASSTSTFVELYEPIQILKPVAENIWIVDGPIEHMTQVGLTVPFPTRMSVIKLANGDLFIHSPIKPNDDLCDALEKLGPIAHLVSPNKIHYASIGVWAARYPQARCWASPGVRERAQAHRIAVNFDHDLGDEAEADWAPDIDQLIFRGSRFMNEVVFFHKSSRTVILADLIENFEPGKLNSVIARTLIRWAGNADPDGKLPIDLRLTFWGRHSVACRSFRRMMAWQPERVILAHGRWYDKNGTAELKRAFRWLSCD